MMANKGKKSDKQRKAMFAKMNNRGVELGKTPQGMNADLTRSANVMPNTPANRKVWSAPGGSRRMDIEGIDTKPNVVIDTTMPPVPVIPDAPPGFRIMNPVDQIDPELYAESISGRTPQELGDIKTQLLDVLAKGNLTSDERKDLLMRVGETQNALKKASPDEFHVDSLLLNEDLLRNSHRNTSFDPEKRAEMEREYFRSEVQSVYNELKPSATTPEQKAQINEEMERFQKKYAEKYNDVLASHGRMLSPMITGPANFPVSRNKKAMNSYENKVRANTEFREKVVKGIEKRWRKENVEAGGGERAILKRRLEEEKESHARMKAANKIMQKKQPTDDKITQLKALGYTDKDIKDATPKNVMTKAKYDENKKWVGPGEMVPGTIDDIRFHVAGANANIKRFEERIRVMDHRASIPTGTLKFNGGHIVDNNEMERVQIFYDERPDFEMTTKLKKSGWHWSPKNKAWQRKRTGAAQQSAKRIVGI